ncbi:Por secretion system C-terminal sorting domain-containing protein [Chitinophaga sp. CF118]|uniref:glycosyl hydrolase family 18 protein n=1 Tax=Chitinophaga sp. CF118 TaxID=1884367 RepID=UPI0008F35882|nr:glycosyl hydrolase family 18 protein [Chitinophaga sp. CF118]SFE06691.1 Por secretion system C-terminal sorting domain-containing protein [Chitinophaga sp. CF118]
MTTKKWISACMLFGASLIASSQSFAQFKVVGYMPSWSGDVNTVQYSKLTHINYAFLLPTASGGLQSIENPAKLKSLVSLAHAKGVKVMISVGGWNNGDDGAFESLAANSSYRSAFTTNIVNFVNQYGLDGADIDWEYPDAGASANNYVTLMTQLSSALHAKGKLLTAAVVGTGGASILSSVFSQVDFLTLMAYDYNNYDHSTYTYASQSVNYWKGRGLPAAKAILGVPFYGRPSWSSYATLVNSGASPYADTFNGNGYNGITTIKKKVDLAYDQAGGIMIWELSQDLPSSSPYSLLSAIHEEKIVKGGGGGGTSKLIQAESYTSMSGVKTEATTDANGGSNVGSIDTGDWMAYSNVNFPTTGSYKVEYRVASLRGGGKLSLDLNAGTIVLGSLNVPSTAGWQTWTTISHTVTVNAGTYALGIYGQTGGFNLNWIRITKVASAARMADSSVTTPELMSKPEDATPHLLVYPNPVTSTLYIKGDYDVEGALISIYDFNGNQVLNVKGSTNKISVEALPAGAYVLVYTKGMKKIAQKFIKQ